MIVLWYSTHCPLWEHLKIQVAVYFWFCSLVDCNNVFSCAINYHIYAVIYVPLIVQSWKTDSTDKNVSYSTFFSIEVFHTNWKFLITEFSCNYLDIICLLLFGVCNGSISDLEVMYYQMGWENENVWWVAKAFQEGCYDIFQGILYQHSSEEAEQGVMMIQMQLPR